MSDPVKNAEVEDVLSSIRRLVSEEKRPLQPAPPEEMETPALAEKPVAPSFDRLVLTPALRVEDTEEVATASTQPLVLTPDLQETDTSEPQDDAASGVEDAATAKDDVSMHDAEENTVTDITAPASTDDPSDDYQDDPYNFDDADDVDGEGASQPEKPAVADATSALSAKIAALETAIGDISDEWEPDGKSADAYAGKETTAMIWEDDIEAERSEALDDTSEDHPVSERTEAIRDAISENASEAVLQGVEKAVQDVAFEEIMPETPEISDDDAEQATKDDDPIDLAAEEQMLDEDALREMISEIVQSELQGALGERITRNVRRLVRREIHRALTARDLD